MPSFASGLLWELQSSPDKPSSFLFGTMHVRDKRAFALEPLVNDCIMRCTALACEVDVRDPEQQLPMDAVMLPPGLTLPEMMRPRQWEKMRRIILKAFDIDLMQYRNLQPIFLQQLLSEQLLKKDLPTYLDALLLEFAAENDIPTFGLESMQEQMEILSQIPLQQQLQTLTKISRNVNKFRQHFQRLTETYLHEDIQRIYQATYRSLGNLRRILLFERNQRMADRIYSSMQDQPVFYAVGAAHLAGGKGILRKLKHKGLTIRPAH